MKYNSNSKIHPSEVTNSDALLGSDVNSMFQIICNWTFWSFPIKCCFFYFFLFFYFFKKSLLITCPTRTNLMARDLAPEVSFWLYTYIHIYTLLTLTEYIINIHPYLHIFLVYTCQSNKYSFLYAWSVQRARESFLIGWSFPIKCGVFLVFFKSLLLACPTHTNPPGSGLGTGGILFDKHILNIKVNSYIFFTMRLDVTHSISSS